MKEVMFETNSFILESTLWSIVLASQGSLALMFIPMMLGLPVLLCTAFFIASLFLSIRILTAKATYIVWEKGVTRELDPFLLKSFWSKRLHTHIDWKDIKSYVVGKELSRGLKEFTYLNIKSDKHDFSTNDKKVDKQAFENFKSAFIENVKTYNSTIVTKPIAAPTKHAPFERNKPIKKRKSFYETFLAKVITIGFAILLLGLALFMIESRNGRLSNWFRLMFIILPGSIYMVYRIFFGDQKKD